VRVLLIIGEGKGSEGCPQSKSISLVVLGLWPTVLSLTLFPVTWQDQKSKRIQSEYPGCGFSRHRSENECMILVTTGTLWKLRGM
jgi:hypothetical protein